MVVVLRPALKDSGVLAPVDSRVVLPLDSVACYCSGFIKDLLDSRLVIRWIPDILSPLSSYSPSNKQILRNLKEAFWPFQSDRTRSLFLRAAYAANCIDGESIAEESGFELASAKAAQHRLDRGVWTSVRYGDMRRALAACERLILLDFDSDELRDYSILLYHCGLYKESLQYLQKYQSQRNSSIQKQSSDGVSNLEKYAVEKLMVRLKLISMEEGWSRPPYVKGIFSNNSEPW